MDDLDDDIAALIGEPEPEKTASEPKERTALHKLLLKSCPAQTGKGPSIQGLADAMSMTPAGVYRIIEKNRITAARARIIAELDNETEFEDFLPYLG